jgi:hypothetical protein
MVANSVSNERPRDAVLSAAGGIHAHAGQA